MRIRLCRSLPLLLILTAPGLFSADAQVSARALAEQKRDVVFHWPSTLQVVESTKIRVIPGDVVTVEIPPEEANRDRQVIHTCRWEEESTVLLFFKKKKKVIKPFPVQLQLGQQTRLAVTISGNDPQQLTRERPLLREVAYEPGVVSIAGTVNTSLPQKPRSDADCRPNPLPSGETWYRVSVRITRFQ